jgi:hypothetical protein
MNPLVRVAAAPGSIEEASSPDQLRQFDLVVAAGLPLLQVKQLDDSCAQAGTAFMAAAAPGPGGYFFLNLHQHSYMPKVIHLSVGYALKVQWLLLQSAAAGAPAACVASACAADERRWRAVQCLN